MQIDHAKPQVILSSNPVCPKMLTLLTSNAPNVMNIDHAKPQVNLRGHVRTDYVVPARPYRAPTGPLGAHSACF